jgi:hypothetical protein
MKPMGPPDRESLFDGAGIELDQLARLVAERVVELLQASSASRDVLIDATEVARRFGVDRGWVYAHARDLGAVRLGDGRRPRLRFDPSTVATALTRAAPTKDQTSNPVPTSPRRRATPREANLLPIGPKRGVKSRRAV